MSNTQIIICIAAAIENTNYLVISFADFLDVLLKSELRLKPDEYSMARVTEYRYWAFPLLFGCHAIVPMVYSSTTTIV